MDNKLPEPKYWKDYVHIRTRAVVEAVELDYEVIIAGVIYLPGDYSYKTRTGEYKGAHQNDFKKFFLPIGAWNEPETISRMDQLVQKIDDLIVDFAKLRDAMMGVKNR